MSQRYGIDAIPTQITEISKKIIDKVKNRAICSILPHSNLHNIPWQTLFKNYGIPWSKLQCSIDFNFLNRGIDTRHLNKISNKCISLGYGFAGVSPDEISLDEEAQKFADIFGKNGRYITNCTKSEVAKAIESNAIVLLSCHGSEGQENGYEFQYFNLKDGKAILEDIIPEKVLSNLVILSACFSGVYYMQWADYPVGIAPYLIRNGVKYCIGARYPVDARYAAYFVEKLAENIIKEANIKIAFSKAKEQTDEKYVSLRDTACFELLGT